MAEDSITDVQLNFNATVDNLKIKVESNELPSLVSYESIDYSQGKGYGSITLSLDGKTAHQRLALMAAKRKGSFAEEPLIQGSVFIQVQIPSVKGLKSTFEIKFEVRDYISTLYDGPQTLLTQAEIALKLSEAKKFEDILTQTMILKEKLKEQYSGIEVDKPRISIVEITKTGVINMEFSNTMIVPTIIPPETEGRLLSNETETNLAQQLKVQKMIDLQISYDLDIDTESDFHPVDDYSWNVTKFDKNSMQIQMYFTDPIKVSQINGIDSVQLKFDDTRLLYDFVGQDLQNGTLLRHEIPA